METIPVILCDKCTHTRSPDQQYKHYFVCAGCGIETDRGYLIGHKEPRKLKKAGYIYFAKSYINGHLYCKIGRASKLGNYHVLSLKLPVEIEIFREISVGDTITAEKAFHEYFDSKRKEGEWFELSDEDYEEIQTKGILLIINKPFRKNI